MKVALVQFKTTENILFNIERMKQIILSIDSNWIVLPELWICPYDNDKIQEAKKYQHVAKNMLKQCALENHVWIVGGTIPYDNQNLCFIFDDHGNKIAQYAKAHLLEVHARHTYTERDVFDAGNALCSFNTPWGKFGVLICYDIRFPEMARLLAQSGVQLLFVPAAFNTQVGKLHWKPLLQTRAMENEIFIVGVNPDYTYKNYQAYGHSIVVHPFGNIQFELENQEIGIHEIDLNEVIQIRKRMPLWKLRRTDLYEIKENSHEGN